MKYIVDDEGCLFDDWYIKLTYYPNAQMKFFIVCYLIVQVISFYQLTRSWRRSLSYRNQANQWTGFYMVTASVMKELNYRFLMSFQIMELFLARIFLY